jgi:hypothetical protein
MSIGQVGIQIFFRFFRAGRATSIRMARMTKALRIIFAGRLGSTPAITTLLTANHRNIFIIFVPMSDCLSLCLAREYGLNVYWSSRNLRKFCFRRLFGRATTYRVKWELCDAGWRGPGWPAAVGKLELAPPEARGRATRSHFSVPGRTLRNQSWYVSDRYCLMADPSSSLKAPLKMIISATLP